MAHPLNYALYAVFSLDKPLPRDEEEYTRIVGESLDYACAGEATVRGWYDLGGLRADADLMVWFLNEDPPGPPGRLPPPARLRARQAPEAHVELHGGPRASRIPR